MWSSANFCVPYEKDPSNPIVTSAPGESFERHDPDHLKLKYFNPESPLQKCGHGSYVETQLGEVYLLHLCARPFVPELRCTLGRETAIQKMEWTLHQSQKIPERNTRTERPVHYPSGKRTETRTFEYKNPGGRRARLSPLKYRRAALLVRMELWREKVSEDRREFWHDKIFRWILHVRGIYWNFCRAHLCRQSKASALCWLWFLWV